MVGLLNSKPLEKHLSGRASITGLIRSRSDTGFEKIYSICVRGIEVSWW